MKHSLGHGRTEPGHVHGSGQERPLGVELPTSSFASSVHRENVTHAALEYITAVRSNDVSVNTATWRERKHPQ